MLTQDCHTETLEGGDFGGRGCEYSAQHMSTTESLLAMPLLSKHGKNFQMLSKQTEKKEQQEMLKFMSPAPRSRVDSTHNALTKRLQQCHSITGAWHESCKPGRGHLHTCTARRAIAPHNHWCSYLPLSSHSTPVD